MQEYNQTDKQIHWLSQVIAKANRTFVPEKEDDSHTNLGFDHIGGRLFGRWIDVPTGRVILTLNLNKQSFEWLDEKQNVLDEVLVQGKSLEQLEKDVSKYPETIKILKDEFFSPLHFEIPDYGIVSIGKNDLSDEGLQQWTFFRSMANNACRQMLDYLQKDEEIRIWPHHFDTGIYTMATTELGLGFGLAIEDVMVGQPYFYLSGYNQVTPLSYENPEQLTYGSWETQGQWKGAVLPLEELTAISAEQSERIVRRFIQEATDWFLSK